MKEELWGLRLNENVSFDMKVDLIDNWKVSKKIIYLLPETYLVQKVIEILYSNWAKIKVRLP